MSMTTSSGPPKLPWNKHAGLQGERHPHKTSASNGRLRPWGRPARGRAGVAPSSDCDGCCIPAPCCHEMLSTQFGLSAGKNAKKKLGPRDVPATPGPTPGPPGPPRKFHKSYSIGRPRGRPPQNSRGKILQSSPGREGGTEWSFQCVTWSPHSASDRLY